MTSSYMFKEEEVQSHECNDSQCALLLVGVLIVLQAPMRKLQWCVRGGCQYIDGGSLTVQGVHTGVEGFLSEDPHTAPAPDQREHEPTPLVLR